MRNATMCDCSRRGARSLATVLIWGCVSEVHACPAALDAPLRGKRVCVCMCACVVRARACGYQQHSCWFRPCCKAVVEVAKAEIADHDFLGEVDVSLPLRTRPTRQAPLLSSCGVEFRVASTFFDEHDEATRASTFQRPYGIPYESTLRIVCGTCKLSQETCPTCQCIRRACTVPACVEGDPIFHVHTGYQCERREEGCVLCPAGGVLVWAWNGPGPGLGLGLGGLDKTTTSTAAAAIE
ncbi:hypothetical protein B0T22DRAFT_304283 [Podospora appendiculata]|uniref:Uncharacterized protein n=1 Tax=Podospora appendiculata TaxID=314037 RepID=A0AAE1C7D2_9PEZI|nr:hypothetical protein B0T22DRAFT_304283 [Podospora appendiculata]